MHKPSISILGPGPDVMLIEGFDCKYMATDRPQLYSMDSYKIASPFTVLWFEFPLQFHSLILTR